VTAPSPKRHEDSTRWCPAGSVLEHLEHLEGGAVPVEARGLCHTFSGLIDMGYKEEKRAPMQRTDYSPLTYFLSATH
jgi:hypothetical protein